MFILYITAVKLPSNMSKTFGLFYDIFQIKKTSRHHLKKKQHTQKHSAYHQTFPAAWNTHLPHVELMEMTKYVFWINWEENQNVPLKCNKIIKTHI